MIIKYVQPLPTIDELEGQLKLETLKEDQRKVIEGERRALQSLEKTLECFPATKEEAIRMKVAEEQKRYIGFGELGGMQSVQEVWRCIDPRFPDSPRYQMVECLYGRRKISNHEELELLKRQGYSKQQELTRLGPHGEPHALSDFSIEVRGLSTSHERLKEQGSKLYVFVTSPDGVGMCGECGASYLLRKLKDEIGVPVVACFDSLEGVGDSPREALREKPYIPLIAVRREKRAVQTLAETTFDQFLAEWEK